MKIKTLNGLLIIDVLTIFLILAITLVPSSTIRIVLGVPFLLFFPGYTLVAALFARQEGMDVIERIALSFGMSIAVTALIGLGLNYTPWGIRLLPVLFSISAFVIIMSGIALFQRKRYGNRSLTVELNLKLPGWEGSSFNKALTVILALAIVGAIGTLTYTIAFPKLGEKFTEFYILGINGKATDYPSDFVLIGSQPSVITVQYGSGAVPVAEKYGRVTLGIVNQEQQKASYSVVIQIDGHPANIIYQGQGINRLDGIQLDQGAKWEKEIGFAPQHVGDNQKVEFFLYRDGAADPEDTLHLGVNVKGS